MSLKPFISQEKHEVWELMRFKRASFNQWQDEKRSSRAPAHDSVQALADVLRPVILFLAKGSGHNAKFTRGPAIGTLHMRAWVLLYAVRPDLVEGETMRAAARRFGVSAIRVGDIMREFRACVPGFDPLIESRRHYASNPQESSENHSKSMVRIWAERKKAREL